MANNKLSKPLALRVVIICGMILAAATITSAQSILAQWNANDNTDGNSFYGTSAGRAGMVAGYNQGSPALPIASFGAEPLVNGAPVDPGSFVNGFDRNLSYIVNPPLTSALNNSVGTSFMTSTAGVTAAISINWSQTVGWRSSRYWQILVTTDGTNFNIPEAGTGSSFSGTVNGYDSGGIDISGTATVSVSDTGFIEFITIDGNHLSRTSTSTAPIENYDVGYVNGLSLTLPTGFGYENNPTFGFAIVGSFDPTYLGTDGAEGYISSFAGLNSLDTVNGYNRSQGSGGSMKMDYVTIVPEPGTYAAILGVCGLMVVLLRRRIG